MSVGNVQFVSVPDAGVPNAPPFTTGAPAVPTFTAKAVATPVPSPEIPEATGRPVQFVRVPDAGVPNTGAVMTGEANVGEMKLSFCCVKFEPSVHTDIVLPAGMMTVVPPVGVVPFLAVALVIVAVYAVEL